MAELRVVDSVAPGTSKAVDVNYFSTSLSQVIVSDAKTQRPTSFRVHISLVTSSVVEYTVDGETTWNELNTGTAIANQGLGFLIPMQDGSSFNLRNKTTSVIKVCEVVDISEHT